MNVPFAIIGSATVILGVAFFHIKFIRFLLSKNKSKNEVIRVLLSQGVSLAVSFILLLSGLGIVFLIGLNLK